MFRNFVYNICYTMGVCFIVCTGIYEDLNGMGKIGTTFTDIISAPSVVPITSDFPYFLSSRISRNPAEWPSALDNVSPIVSHLVSNKDHEDLSIAYESIRRVSDYSFEDFVRFCSSEYCGTRHKKFVVDFFTLMVVVLQKLPQVDETAKVTEDFKEFIDKVLPKRDCTLTTDDSILFKRVAFVLDDFE